MTNLQLLSDKDLVRIATRSPGLLKQGSRNFLLLRRPLGRLLCCSLDGWLPEPPRQKRRWSPSRNWSWRDSLSAALRLVPDPSAHPPQGSMLEKHFDARTPVSPFMIVCWYCRRSSHLPFHLASGVPGVLLLRHFMTAVVISVSTHRSQFGCAPEAFTCPRSGPDACWPQHLCPGAARH